MLPLVGKAGGAGVTWTSACVWPWLRAGMHACTGNVCVRVCVLVCAQDACRLHHGSGATANDCHSTWVVLQDAINTSPG